MDKIALKPRLSEKTLELSESLNTYVFEVPKSVNKHSVARAVSEQFKVTVTNVRLSNIPATRRKMYRKRGQINATRAGVRKAYVSLKDGDKLPIFNAADANAKPSKETK